VFTHELGNRNTLDKIQDKARADFMSIIAQSEGE